MPKRAIRIPALRAGRRVRWTLEVSANVGDGSVHPKKSRKHTRAKRPKNPSRAASSPRPVATAAALIPTAAPPSTPPVVVPAERIGFEPISGGAQMSSSASRMTAREMVVMAVVGAVILGAIALTAFPSLRVVVVPPARNAPPEALAHPVHDPAAERTEPRRVSLAAPGADVAPQQVAEAVVEKPKEKPKQTPVRSTILWPPPSLRSSPPAVAAATGAGPVSSETDVLGRTMGSPAATSDAVSPAITMSGCLEATVDGDQFRLTDVEGTDAPKARSWKSGFLRKRSAPVDLVELSDPVGLRKYVGRRMVATGQLSGRELRVRSLQAAGAPCQ
jgi:hypothetical protein